MAQMSQMTHSGFSVYRHHKIQKLEVEHNVCGYGGGGCDEHVMIRAFSGYFGTSRTDLGNA